MNIDFIKMKQICLPMYPYNIAIFLLSKKGLSNLEESEEAKTIKVDGNIFVYLRNNNVSVLVHELFHVVEFIMNGIGQSLGDCPNETWAYLIGYLTKESLQLLDSKIVPK